MADKEYTHNFRAPKELAWRKSYTKNPRLPKITDQSLCVTGIESCTAVLFADWMEKYRFTERAVMITSATE